MSLRPSNLPKLAVCPCYVSNPDAGPAAARGSALDALFRARMQGDLNQAEMFYQPSADDLAAVEWAANTLRRRGHRSTASSENGEFMKQIILQATRKQYDDLMKFLDRRCTIRTEEIRPVCDPLRTV